MSMKATWNGEAVSRLIDEAGEKGLFMAGSHLLDESRNEVPFEEGTLSNTADVFPDVGNRQVSVVYDQPYAVIQHEAMGFRHDAGRKAKYLEDPLNHEADKMVEAVAKSIKRVL